MTKINQKHQLVGSPQVVRRHLARRGQATVEMALAITVLLLITVGILQYGIIMNATITLSQLARDGARYAGINARGSDPEQKEQKDVEAAIRNYVRDACASTTISASDLPNSRIKITYFDPNDSTKTAKPSPARGDAVKVELVYPMGKKIFAPISFPGLSGLNGDYSKSATMVIEGA